MEKIKRFIDLYIPVESCTFRCHYCYITHHRKFDNKLPILKYSAEQVRAGLSKDRMGGPCLINMCGGGETLLPPPITKYIRVLLEEGHYVMVVTNASVTKRFEEIAQFPPELMKRLFFKFSYHYLELKKRGMLERFASNVKMMSDAGASYTIEATPSDELIPFIEEMKDFSIKHFGAITHVTVARNEAAKGNLPILTNLSHEDYEKTWNSFKSEFFHYKFSIFNKKRTEFCYAGDWSFVINVGTGMMQQCYCSYYKQNILDDPTKPIKFIPVGNNCNQYHCYNGHAFLCLGDIPEHDAPTYATIRNRICADGSEWLKPEMKSFMSSKLKESNREYSDSEKKDVNKKIKLLMFKKKIDTIWSKVIWKWNYYTKKKS